MLDGDKLKGGGRWLV